MNDRLSRLTIATFMIALWIPLAVMVLGPGGRVSKTENRFLAPSPVLGTSWQSWTTWPHRAEAWFDDHLGLRNRLIRSQAQMDIGLFGVSPTDSLIIGKDGWLFFGDEDAIANYRGVAPLGPAALAHWQRVLEQRQAWLADRGIAFLFVLVPDKHSVYAEYMPSSLPRSTNLDPLDQLVSHLAAHSDVNVLDLRPALAEAAKGERIYHRTDTHWNGPGAAAAYRAILARLRLLVPALADAEPIPMRREERDTPGLGLSSIVGLGHWLREESIEMIPESPRSSVKREFRKGYEDRVVRQTPFAHGVADRALPRAVMFRDSFANALIPYLSEHFSRILYVWERDVSPRAVLIEKPDVVIHEMVGRFVGRRPRSIEEAGAQPRSAKPSR